MNQVLKKTIYGKGNNQQIEFLEKLTGMNAEECEVFERLHKQESDLEIQTEMGLDKKAFALIEELLRVKLAIGVIECINYTMDNKGKF